MEIKHRIVTPDNGFRRFLCTNGIPHENSDLTGFTVLEINESDPKWETVKTHITANNISYDTTAIYTESELNSAPWLTVRSKRRWEYPMPDNGKYLETVYSLDEYCPSCGKGAVQKDLFRVKKSPKWGSSHFLMLNWIEDELFVSEKAKEILSRSGLTGFTFSDVLKYKKDTKLDDIYQLRIENTAKNGFVADGEYITAERKCPCCNSVKWIINGRGFPFNTDALNDCADIVKTREGFGDCKLHANKIIISHNFYKVLKENKLCKNLEFTPIIR